MKLRENLDVFLNEFASEACFSDPLIKYSCIFDNDYSPSNIIGVEGRIITALFKEADLQKEQVHHNTICTVDGKPYKVIGIQPQMDGFVILELKE